MEKSLFLEGRLLFSCLDHICRHANSELSPWVYWESLRTLKWVAASGFVMTRIHTKGLPNKVNTQ